MSVMIKGMDMPYGCANCPFCSLPVYDAKGHADYFCNVDVEGIIGSAVTSEVIRMYEGDTHKTFPDWCPLVEIPTPHGKLVDIDAMIDKFWDGDYMEINCRDLRNIPVIVKAEDIP
ncbi:MAG: hypothetical protein IKD66_00525 [Solobacterium sp.]|nr:hypothetical protein [Solobacterium sp.]